MTDVIFNDFYWYIREALLQARYDVKIAVAWLNFKIYSDIFSILLKKHVKLQIIINDDFINSKHDEVIECLRKNGAVIYKRKMPTTKQYMHEKFCIIDNERVLNGSYNWSLNANKNFENLMSSTKKLVVDKFIKEYELIIGMNVEYIRELQKCSSYNIMVLEEAGNLTKGTIYNIKDGELQEIEQEFYEGWLLSNLHGIYYKYDSLIEESYEDPYELEAIDARIDFEMQQYLSTIRRTKTPVSIHAIGVIAREMYHRNFEDIYIKVLWKERFCASNIEDRYELY